MKHIPRWSILAFLAVAGCEEATPTGAVLQQGVFNALGGLGVGESLSLNGADAAEILLAGRPGGGDFIYIPFYALGSGSGRLQLTVAGSSIEEPGPASALLPSDPGLLARDRGPVQDWEMHEEMHARMTAQVGPLLAQPRRTVLSGEPPAVRTDLSSGNAQIDQTVELNANAFGLACETEDLRTGRVEAISDGAIVVADVDNPAGGFTRSDYQSFADDFDRLVDPTLTTHFGEPTDIDDNGRVIIFFTRAVNELTAPGSEGFIGGFFWVRDLFVQSDCGASNQGEIFFSLVPDPDAEASGIRHTREGVLRGAVGTIGHEYQHLINAGRRIWVNDATSLEEVWLDEGLSHIAEELLFYADSGLEPGTNVTWGELSQPIIDSINQFMVQNLARYGLYLEEVSGASPTGSDGLTTRGATWSFLRYVADLSGRSDAEFFQALADTPETGFSNLAASLDDTPLNWLQRWGVSVYTDDLVARSGPLLQQPSWNFRTLLPQLFDTFPLQVRTLSPGADLNLRLAAATSGYVRVRPSGEVARIMTTSGGDFPGNNLRVTVIRTE